SDNFREKLDVTTVITGNADRADVLLDRGAHDVANGSMISQIHGLDSVADELEIDRVDRAVVRVANRDGSQNSDRLRHELVRINRIFGFQNRISPSDLISNLI